MHRRNAFSYNASTSAAPFIALKREEGIMPRNRAKPAPECDHTPAVEGNGRKGRLPSGKAKSRAGYSPAGGFYGPWLPDSPFRAEAEAGASSPAAAKAPLPAATKVLQESSRTGINGESNGPPPPPAGDQVGDQVEEKLPPRRLVKYSAIRGAGLRCLWPGFIYYGQTHTVCGPTDAGKSTLAGAIIAAATGGPRLPGMPAKEDGWAFLAGNDEVNPELVKLRLKGAGANLDRVESLHHVQDEKVCELAMPRDADQIIADIDGRRPGVIIVDVGPDLLPGGVSFNDNDAVAAYYRGWQRVGAETGLAVVTLVHPPWSQSSVPNARAGGATKWTTCPDVFMWLVLENEETHKHVMGVKRSRCGERPPALSFYTELLNGPAVVRRWGGCNLLPEQIASAMGDQVQRREVERCVEMLKAYVPEGGIESHELEKLILAQSVSQRTFERARGQVKLKAYRKPKSNPAVWMWRPPVNGWPK